MKKKILGLLVAGSIIFNTIPVNASPEMAIHEEQKGVAMLSADAEPEIDNPTKSMYSDENLYLLAHLINGEAGSDWCSDEMMFYVGSVVLNRVQDDRFPDTVEEVIFQEGQYACTWDGNFDLKPSDRAWEIANDLLYMGSVLPSNVVFQAQFTQGEGIYLKEQNMYFCY